jgi:hypothetical protein
MFYSRRTLITGLFLLFQLIGMSTGGNALGGQSPPNPPRNGAPASDRHNVSKNASFKNTLAGDLILDGRRMGFTTWEGSDGSKIGVIHYQFESPIEAKTYFGNKVGEAIRIIKRGKLRDRKGRIVGERAEVILGSNESPNMVPTLLFVGGPHFYRYDGTTLEALLKFENENRP